MLGARNLSRRGSAGRRLVALQLIENGALRSGAVFARASAGSYFTAGSVLAYAANDVPRFTGPTGRLLLEAADTNRKVRSLDVALAGADWNSNGGASSSGNAGTAPDGTMTATRIDMAAQSSSGFFQYSVASLNNGVTPFASGSVNCLSLFMKRVTGAVPIRFGLDNCFAVVDLGTGAVNNTQGYGGLAAFMEDAGSGWWRVILSFSPESNPAAIVIYNAENTACSVLVWGLQTEVGGYPGSFIKTSGQQTTRDRDSLAFPLTASQGTQGTIIGTVFMRAVTGDAAGTLLSLGVDASNGIDLVLASDGTLAAQRRNGGAAAVSATRPFARATLHRFALAYGGGLVSLSLNGGTVTTVSGAPTAAAAQLVLAATAYASSGYVTAEYGPLLSLNLSRLSDAQLVAASTP